eukprot:1303503-Prymnesium_polylepis.1
MHNARMLRVAWGMGHVDMWMWICGCGYVDVDVDMWMWICGCGYGYGCGCGYVDVDVDVDMDMWGVACACACHHVGTTCAQVTWASGIQRSRGDRPGGVSPRCETPSAPPRSPPPGAHVWVWGRGSFKGHVR